MKFHICNYSYPGLVKALADRGHEVLGMTGGPDQFNWWQHLVNEKKTNEEYDRILRAQIEEHRPDVFLCGKGWHMGKMIRPETVEWIRERVGCTVYWSLDDPDFLPTFKKLGMRRGYDVALTCTGACVPEYAAMGMDAHLFWPAFDRVAREPWPIVPEKEKIADFLIVGTPYTTTNPPRRDVAMAIASTGMDLRLHGTDAWTGSEFGDTGLWKYYHGHWSDWGKVHHLFASARINFSNHLHHAREYLNDRVPMVLGVAGFLIMDRIPGLGNWFVEDEEVVYYDSLEDLVAKAFYYLKRPEERERIGENARAIVLQHHTYDVRAMQLLDVLERRGLR